MNPANYNARSPDSLFLVWLPCFSRKRWLVKGAKAGDSLFMHYSGHGGSVKDHTGDEEDQKDETMVPVDYAKSGQIKDDEILKEVRVYA